MRLKKRPLRLGASAVLSLGLLLFAVPTTSAQDIDFDAMMSGSLQLNSEDKYGLADALASGLAEVREQAVAAAGEFGPDTITVIAPLLDNDNAKVVEATKAALKKIVANAAQNEETQQEASRALAYEASRVDNRNPLLHLLGEYGSFEALEILWRISQNNEESYEAAMGAIEQIGARTDHHRLMGLSLGLITAFRTEDGPKREILIETMGTIGMDDFVPHLIWEVNNGPDKDLAIEALGKIAHPESFDAVHDYYLKTQSDEALDALLSVMEFLPQTQAREEYKALASIAHPPHVRVAAIEGLARVATAETIPFLAEQLTAAHQDVRNAAWHALMAQEGEEFTAALQAYTLEADAETKPGLLYALHDRDPEAAQPAIEAALTNDSAAVRVAAWSLAGETPRFDQEETYLDASRHGVPESRQLALQGYLSLAEEALSQGDKDKALEMFHSSLSMAQEDQERIRALAGLAEIASPDTLPYLEGMAHRESILIPLAECAIAIAKQVAATDSDMALDIYEHILELGNQHRAIHELNEDEYALLNEVQENMRALGVDVSFLQEAGIVSNWHVIGPFPFEAFDAAYAPEEEAFDPAAVYSGVGSRQVEWEHIQLDTLPGVVQLHPMLRPNRDVAAYARATVQVDAAKPGYLKLGSDDGVKVWINDQLVHENNVERELKMDQDVKPVSLQAGENEILLKVTQTTGEWQYVVRLTDRQNAPLDFNN